MSEFTVTVTEENVLVVDIGNLVAGGGGGSGSNLASDSLLDTGTFNGIFDNTTTNVQAALEIVDDAIAGKANTVHAHIIGDVTGLQTALDGKSATSHLHTGVYEPANANLQAHVIATNNPHSVTAAQVGTYTTGQIDTSLSGKENVGVAAGLISAHEGAPDPHPQYLTSTEGNAAYASSSHLHAGVYEPANGNIQTHISSTSNPHSTTAAQVGAYTTGQVDTALSGKADTSHSHIIGDVTGLQTALDGKAATTHNHDGVYETPVNVILVAEGAVTAHELAADPHPQYNYSLPTASATVLGGVKIGAGITIDGDGKIGTSASAPAWGDIVGTLANQTDLNSALAGKADTGHNHTGTYEPANANIQSHIGSTSNPHSVTAAQVGAYTSGEVDTLLTGYALTGHDHLGVYEPAGTAASTMSTHEAALDPHTQYWKDGETIVGGTY